jgi:hypothetical protein
MGRLHYFSNLFSIIARNPPMQGTMEPNTNRMAGKATQQPNLAVHHPTGKKMYKRSIFAAKDGEKQKNLQQVEKMVPYLEGEVETSMPPSMPPSTLSRFSFFILRFFLCSSKRLSKDLLRPDTSLRSLTGWICKERGL